MKRHKWDNPKNPSSATCVKCGCKRFAERFGGRISWVYVKKDQVSELANIPSCL